MDTGLTIEYEYNTGNCAVKATKGVAAWVWLDISAGTLGNFAEHVFRVIPGEKRELSATVKNDHMWRSLDRAYHNQEPVEHYIVMRYKRAYNSDVSFGI